jgi:hypothetical protein
MPLISGKRSEYLSADLQPNDALSGRGPKECQETPWPVPAVRLNA